MTIIYRCLSFFAIIFTLFLVSCEKHAICDKCSEDTDTVVKRIMEESGTEIDEDGTFKKFNCFEFVFPIDINLPDNATATVNDVEALKTEIRNVADQDKELLKEVSLVYPIEVIYKDATKTIDERKDLMRIFVSCYGHKKEFKAPCFKLNFPVEIIDVDGSQLTISDFKDLKEQVKSKEEFDFVYPVTVTTLKEKEEIELNSKEEIQDLRKDCYGKEDAKETCFELDFPVTVLIEDGTSFIANDWQDFKVNLNANDKFNLEYPVSITYTDGTQETVDDEDEMIEIKKDCF